MVNRVAYMCIGLVLPLTPALPITHSSTLHQRFYP